MILDDLHAADPLSLQAFKVLGLELSRAGSMVIGVYRDSEVRRFQEFSDLLLDPLIRNSRQILLGAFDDVETREFAASRGVTSVHEARLAAPILFREGIRGFWKSHCGSIRWTRVRSVRRITRGCDSRRDCGTSRKSVGAIREVLSIASVAGVEFRLSSLFHVLEGIPQTCSIRSTRLNSAVCSNAPRFRVPTGFDRRWFRKSCPLSSAELVAPACTRASARFWRRFILTMRHLSNPWHGTSMRRHCSDALTRLRTIAVARRLQAHRELRSDDSSRFYHMAMVALELTGSNAGAIRDLQQRLEDLESTRDRLLPLNQFSLTNGGVRKAPATGANARLETVDNPSSLVTSQAVEDAQPESSELQAGGVVGRSKKTESEIGGTVSPDLAVHPLPQSRENTFLREGDFWTLIFEGRVLRLKHSNGLLFTAHLLRHPHRDFHVSQLVALLPTAEATERPTYVSHAERQRLGMHAVTKWVPTRFSIRAAKNEYRRRIEELNDGLGQARELHDADRRRGIGKRAPIHRP